MFELVWAFLLSLAAWSVHFFLWRVRVPKRQTRALLFIFSSIFISTFILFTFTDFKWNPTFSPASWFAVGLFHFAAMCAYIITYSAVEVDSPSLLITKLVEDRKNMSVLELHRILNDQVLVLPRVRDLVRDRHLIHSGGRYHLTTKGRGLARLFIFYRALLGAPKGG